MLLGRTSRKRRFLRPPSTPGRPDASEAAHLLHHRYQCHLSVLGPARRAGRGYFVDASCAILLPSLRRGVAQLGSASGLGPEGRRFESARPDHLRFNQGGVPASEGGRGSRTLYQGRGSSMASRWSQMYPLAFEPPCGHQVPTAIKTRVELRLSGRAWRGRSSWPGHGRAHPAS